MIHFFVECKLRNPLNGSHGYWASAAGWRKRLREKTRVTALCSEFARRRDRAFAARPKRVEFRAHVWNLYDQDGLRAALKPVLDGCRDCGLIHSDGPGSGHVFAYAQQIDRARRGVEVTVDLLAERQAQGEPEQPGRPERDERGENLGGDPAAAV